MLPGSAQTRNAANGAALSAAPEAPSSNMGSAKRVVLIISRPLYSISYCIQTAARDQRFNPTAPARLIRLIRSSGCSDRQAHGPTDPHIKGARCLCRHRAPVSSQTFPIFCLFNPERIQRAAHRDLVQIGCLGHRSCADGAELVAQVEARGDRQTDPAANATPHRHVLLATDLVGDRVADDAGSQTSLPQDLASLTINGAEVA